MSSRRPRPHRQRTTRPTPPRRRRNSRRSYPWTALIQLAVVVVKLVFVVFKQLHDS